MVATLLLYLFTVPEFRHTSNLIIKGRASDLDFSCRRLQYEKLRDFSLLDSEGRLRREPCDVVDVLLAMSFAGRLL